MSIGNDIGTELSEVWACLKKYGKRMDLIKESINKEMGGDFVMKVTPCEDLERSSEESVAIKGIEVVFCYFPLEVAEFSYTFKEIKKMKTEGIVADAITKFKALPPCRSHSMQEMFLKVERQIPLLDIGNKYDLQVFYIKENYNLRIDLETKSGSHKRRYFWEDLEKLGVTGIILRSLLDISESQTQELSWRLEREREW